MQSLLSHSLFQNRKFFPTNVDKTPKVKAWKADAKIAEEALKFWTDETNFAMPTGEGLIVIDIDPRHGGKEEDVYKLGFPQGTFKVKTPSGGCHLYYKPEGFNIQTGVNRLGDGIDIRSDGGYVCVPPKAGYEIVCDYAPKAVQRYEVKAALDKFEKQKEAEKSVVIDPAAVITEGSRNQTLFKQACSLQAKGVPEVIIRAGIQALNLQTCNPPLPEKEVDTIVASAITRYESGKVMDDLEVAWWNAKELFDDWGEAKEEFAWNKHIPKAMASMVVARGGQGKSTFLLYVIRDILNADPNATALWLPVENNMFDTRIKMNAMGLGSNKRFYVGGKRKPGEKRGTFSFDFTKQGDLIQLENMIQAIKPTVVVIDSLRAMSSADLNQKGIGDVMSALQSIICETAGASLVYIHHCNKRTEGPDVNRIMGNASIDAQVRVAYSLEFKDKQTRILKLLKTNLLHKPAYLAFVQEPNGDYNHAEVSEEEAVTGQDGLSLDVEQALDEIYEAGLAKGRSLSQIARAFCDELNLDWDNPDDQRKAWGYVNPRKARHSY